MNNYKVVVEVKQAVKKLSNWDDRNDKPMGKYEYLIKGRNKADAMMQALDEFHDTISIGCLDDFEINADVRKV